MHFYKSFLLYLILCYCFPTISSHSTRIFCGFDKLVIYLKYYFYTTLITTLLFFFCFCLIYTFVVNRGVYFFNSLVVVSITRGATKSHLRQFTPANNERSKRTYKQFYSAANQWLLSVKRFTSK